MYIYFSTYMYDLKIIRKESNLIFYKAMRVLRLFMEIQTWIRNKKHVKEISSS